MSEAPWSQSHHQRLLTAGVDCAIPDSVLLTPAWLISVRAEDWYDAVRIGAASGYRFAGLWGDPERNGCTVRVCLEQDGNYLVQETRLPSEQLRLASVADLYPGAGRMERHLRDLMGVAFAGSNDGRRWVRHRAWRADQYPLRPEFPAIGQPPRRSPGDTDYPFQQIRGAGVYDIPVGPVHAGIIESGHFRFQAVGEEVLQLEQRLGYVHKGIEKIAVGRPMDGLAHLAGRVSGDSTVAHTWAACQAMERAAGCQVPRRADYLRAILCERERIANHLGDIGAICNDVAFVFAHMQCARLRERWLRRNGELTGHRLLMDQVIPGGVSRDFDAGHIAKLRADHTELRREIAPLFAIIGDHPSLGDRLAGTGILLPEDALTLGCTGYVGKASGQPFDLRSHMPHAPYDELQIPEPTVFAEGDVAARVRVRMAEVSTSLDLLDQLLDQLPNDGIKTAWTTPAVNATGLGLVEGWRGEIMTFVRFDEQGTIARFFPRDPSWFSWLALERLIHGNIVPDFPVCNKSVNASYSGHDL